jgi:hypothetical protein
LARNLYLAGIFLAATLTTSISIAQDLTAANDLPDNPTVQQSTTQQAPAAQDQAPATTPAAQPDAPAQPSQPQSSPSQSSQSQSQPQSQTSAQSSQDQLRQEEKQRILGIMPTFNMTNNQDALPLTSAEKFQLFFKSTTDPWAFGLVAISAGIGQAKDSPPEWQGGMAGYSKRFAAGYTDTFDGNLWGNAILTSWWHEDPRYYRRGKGSVMSRGLWAAESSFWCKRDNGTWGPNYANVIGNIIGGTIANAYYPPSQRGIAPTFEHSASVTGYGVLGAEFIEFWPDIAHHYIMKHREKLAREAAKLDAQQTAAPAKQP